MFRIFRDAALQSSFERDGFVKLPLLDAADVARLRDHYFELSRGKRVENSVYGVFVSLHAQDVENRRRSMELIRQVVLPRAERYFSDWKTHLGGFWTKLPGPKSFVYPHQDWTFVDDDKMDELYWLTIWIALGDYTPDTGSLGFIKGSHRFFGDVICSPSRVATTPTRGHQALLFSYLTFPELRAGDALAFTSRTIHASLPNLGADPRISVGIALTPREAELYHYFLKPGTEDRVLKLKVDEDFLLAHADDEKMHALWQSGRVPEGAELVAERPRSVTRFTPEQLEELCIRHGNTRHPLAAALP